MAGTVSLPGSKSISNRTLLLAALSRGNTSLEGLLDAARHDEILSAVSHLPHALAFALIADLSARPDAAECFELAGTGLRDFTRLASSHPGMWRDVCLANRDALRRDIASYRAELDRIDALLERRDGNALLALFSHARETRDAWIDRASDGEEI